MDYRDNLLAAKTLFDPHAPADPVGVPAGESDLQEFLQFAERQQLVPTLYTALGPERIRRDLPRRLAARLQALFDRQRARHELLMAALREIECLFRSREIAFVVLKGPILAEELYGGLDARQWSDLDILVRRDALARGRAALEGAGYRALGHSRLPAGVATRFDHAMRLARGEASIDLHWAIRTRPAYRLRESRVWEGLSRRSLAGMELWSFSPEYAVLAATLELAQDAERNAAKAKNLFDLYLLVRAAGERFDWAAFLDNRRPERLSTLTRNVLALLMLALRCGDEFPALRRLVLEGDQPPVIDEAELAYRLLDPESDGAINRWWFGRIYPGNRFLYWGWLGAALLAGAGFPRNVPRLGRAWSRMTAASGRRPPNAGVKGREA